MASGLPLNSVDVLVTEAWSQGGRTAVHTPRLCSTLQSFGDIPSQPAKKSRVPMPFLEADPAHHTSRPILHDGHSERHTDEKTAKQLSLMEERNEIAESAASSSDRAALERGSSEWSCSDSDSGGMECLLPIVSRVSLESERQFSQDLREYYESTRATAEIHEVRSDVITIVNDVVRSMLIDDYQRRSGDRREWGFSRSMRSHHPNSAQRSRHGSHRRGQRERQFAAAAAVMTSDLSGPLQTPSHSSMRLRNSEEDCRRWVPKRAQTPPSTERGPLSSLKVPNVCVFGSTAVGLDTAGSDIDIAVPFSIEHPCISIRDQLKARKLLDRVIDELHRTCALGGRYGSNVMSNTHHSHHSGPTLDGSSTSPNERGRSSAAINNHPDSPPSLVKYPGLTEGSTNTSSLQVSLSQSASVSGQVSSSTSVSRSPESHGRRSTPLYRRRRGNHYHHRRSVSSRLVFQGRAKDSGGQRKEYVLDLRPILRARVPIIKVSVWSTDTSRPLHRGPLIEMDIAALCEQYLMNKIVSFLVECDSRVPVFIVAIKRWAKIRNICDATRHQPNTFGFLLLALKFLQLCDPPVLPVIDVCKHTGCLLMVNEFWDERRGCADKEIVPVPESEMPGYWQTSHSEHDGDLLKKLSVGPFPYCSDNNNESKEQDTHTEQPQSEQRSNELKWHSENTMNVYQLMLSFFEMYSRFDFENLQISITTQRGLENKSNRTTAMMICDVLCGSANNVTRNVKKHTLKLLMYEFWRGYKCLINGDFDQLFRPYSKNPLFVFPSHKGEEREHSAMIQEKEEKQSDLETKKSNDDDGNVAAANMAVVSGTKKYADLPLEYYDTSDNDWLCEDCLDSSEEGIQGDRDDNDDGGMVMMDELKSGADRVGDSTGLTQRADNSNDERSKHQISELADELSATLVTDEDDEGHEWNRHRRHRSRQKKRRMKETIHDDGHISSFSHRMSKSIVLADLDSSTSNFGLSPMDAEALIFQASWEEREISRQYRLCDRARERYNEEDELLSTQIMSPAHPPSTKLHRYLCRRKRKDKRVRTGQFTTLPFVDPCYSLDTESGKWQRRQPSVLMPEVSGLGSQSTAAAVRQPQTPPSSDDDSSGLAVNPTALDVATMCFENVRLPTDSVSYVRLRYAETTEDSVEVMIDEEEEQQHHHQVSDEKSSESPRSSCDSERNKQTGVSSKDGNSVTTETVTSSNIPIVMDDSHVRAEGDSSTEQDSMEYLSRAFTDLLPDFAFDHLHNVDLVLGYTKHGYTMRQWMDDCFAKCVVRFLLSMVKFLSLQSWSSLESSDQITRTVDCLFNRFQCAERCEFSAELVGGSEKKRGINNDDESEIVKSIANQMKGRQTSKLRTEGDLHFECNDLYTLIQKYTDTLAQDRQQRLSVIIPESVPTSIVEYSIIFAECFAEYACSLILSDFHSKHQTSVQMDPELTRVDDFGLPRKNNGAQIRLQYLNGMQSRIDDELSRVLHFVFLGSDNVCRLDEVSFIEDFSEHPC